MNKSLQIFLYSKEAVVLPLAPDKEDTDRVSELCGFKMFTGVHGMGAKKRERLGALIMSCLEFMVVKLIAIIVISSAQFPH
jgi:hypothetical protein